jgi:MFS transporter, ACS family, D-galactonate transporter
MGVLEFLHQRAILAMLARTFCYSYFACFCVTRLAAYCVERWGLSLSTMGFYAFLSFAGIAVMTPLARCAADRVIARGGDPIITKNMSLFAVRAGSFSIA